MPIYSYLHDAVILLGVALAVITLTRLIKVPAIVGFLLTGALIGPHGLGVIQNAGRVEQFAELGVVFLLFEIGLEVSLQRLRGLGRYFLAGGPIQAAATIALAVALCSFFQISLAQSFFFGMILSLSSTAIVLRLYNDRRELNAPHGSMALGILLFQDILIVPYLLVVPLFGSTVETSWADVLLRLGGGIFVLSTAAVAGRFLIPRLLHYLAATKVRELFVMGSLFLCFGAALLTQRLGFSLALGAFLAGVLIADSDYHHQVMAETIPFRDLFNSVFFVSIGMLVDVTFVASHPLEVGIVTLLILAVKSVALFGTAYSLVRTPRVAVMVAMGLSQIGEFSFVLIQVGKMYGLVDFGEYQTAIASSIFTMALTPLLVFAAPLVARQLNPRASQPPADLPPDLSGHVIVVGFGLAGRQLAAALKAAGVPYLIVELNNITVKKARQQGEPIIYGDASRQSILESCRIRGARVIVFVISELHAVRRGVKLARQMNPDIFIIARTRMQSDIPELRACGATDVISEEFETSIEIFTTVLARLRVPGNIIRTQTRLLRLDDYRMLRSQSPVGHLSENIFKALSIGTIDTFLVTESLSVAGKTIVQLDLRKITGAAILALVRSDVPMANPPADTVIMQGDLLVLVGSHAQMDAAFRYLEQGN
jgi:monovalent cation:H+ antiporter-2, CPA2 family